MYRFLDICQESDGCAKTVCNNGIEGNQISSKDKDKSIQLNGFF